MEKRMGWGPRIFMAAVSSVAADVTAEIMLRPTRQTA